MKYHDYEEKKIHGKKDFSLHYYAPQSNFPISSMPLHWHRECELIRVTEGTLRVFFENREYSGDVGDVFLLPSGALHRAEPQESLYECIVFSPELLYGRKNERVLSLITPIISREAEPLFFSAKENPELCGTARELFRTIAKEGDFFELTACGKLLDIFYYICQAESKREKTARRACGHQKANITVLLQWIDKNYAERITLAQMAEVINLNQQYLCRIFKEYVGCSPMEYLNRTRIDKACIEMSVNGKNATEAAYESGFYDLSYFSKVFRRYRGVSPKEYRRGLKQ